MVKVQSALSTYVWRIQIRSAHMFSVCNFFAVFSFFIAEVRRFSLVLIRLITCSGDGRAMIGGKAIGVWGVATTGETLSASNRWCSHDG